LLRLPEFFHGPPIRVLYRPNLLDTAGQPAHAATWIRKRQIVLDPELKQNPLEHQRILLHEYFHFAWVRLGNPKRRAWEDHLAAEWKARVRGEAGWSAEWRKDELKPRDISARTRRWREYCCESFCDTAAWIKTGDHPENTLAAKHRRSRAAWFATNLGQTRLPV
jgi:hypothetical protein